MTYLNEASPAWELFDSLRAVMRDTEVTQFALTLAVGEHRYAIERLIALSIGSGRALPNELVTQLVHWLDGYAHDDDQARLHELLRQISRTPKRQPRTGIHQTRASLASESLIGLESAPSLT